MHKGFIALHIYNHVYVGRERISGFAHPVSATQMVRAGHNGIASRSHYSLPDALVVRRHKRGQTGLTHSVHHMVYHFFTSQPGQRLARESGRPVTGRYDYCKFHLSISWKNCPAAIWAICRNL